MANPLRARRGILGGAGFTIVIAVGILWPSRVSFSWGPEGHTISALIAEHYTTQATLDKVRNLLDGSPMDSVASWADDYRREHRETARWHFIDIPLADAQIDMARECPQGDCVIAKTERFLTVLRDPKASKEEKTEALKFVIHLIGDAHQPLHDEDDGDKGGNARHVIFHGHPDNLHWVWDTGLIHDLSRNSAFLAAQIESEITPQERSEWARGNIEEWVLEGHRLAQTIAYRDLPEGNPPTITRAYEREADPVVKSQLAKAGIRLAYVLNSDLVLTAQTR